MAEQSQPAPGADHNLTGPNSTGPSPTSPNASDASAQTSFLWHTHDYLGEYARFADTKAAFAATLAGALLGCLYGAGLFAVLIRTPIHAWTGTSWATFLAGLALCTSIFLAGLVVYPRLKSTTKTGFIFWGSIAAFGSVSEFRAAFRASTEKDLGDGLQGQVFDVAKYVLIPKYRGASRCLRALVIGAILAGVALILKELP
jgi:hypothetical protein